MEPFILLNNLPKSLQAKAKKKLHQIWMAPNKDEAQEHFDDFISIYDAHFLYAMAIAVACSF